MIFLTILAIITILIAIVGVAGWCAIAAVYIILFGDAIMLSVVIIWFIKRLNKKKHK